MLLLAENSDDTEEVFCEQHLGIPDYHNPLLLGGSDLLGLVEVPESLEEKRWKNRVEKVSQAILKDQMEEAVDKGDDEQDEGDEDDEEGEVDEKREGGLIEAEANIGEKKADEGEVERNNADEWVEDPDSDIMDAKVMKRGDKRLIIVDLPDPKARWRKPI